MNNVNMKFYRCKHCGNFVYTLVNSGVPMICCGEPMEELPLNADGSDTKHLPIVETAGDTVKVHISTEEHPMVEAHYIEWIFLETTVGGQLHKLTPGSKPEAEFKLAVGEQPVAVYEFCNLHGLWKVEL